MIRKLVFTPSARAQLNALRNNKAHSTQAKAIKKTLNYMKSNLKHPGLNTHKYDSYTGENGEEIWEAYAQNKTPGAYRIFWHYGPDEETVDSKNSKKTIRIPVLTIYAITPHP